VQWGTGFCEVTLMPMQTVALVNGQLDMLPWLDHLLDGNQYEVVFSALHTEAYADIKRPSSATRGFLHDPRAS
jgi:hypothetical protein